LGGLLMPHYGWRAVFVMFGLVSLSCVWPLFNLRLRVPGKHTAAAPVPQGPTFALILKQRGLWGASLGLFGANYNFYFILSWLPDYLVRERGFSMSGMATVAGSAYLINALSALGAGWVTAVWRRSGRSTSAFYKSLMAFGHIASMGAMVGMEILPLQGCIACLCLFEIAAGISSPGVYAIPQIIAGPTATGRWVGVQNACGNLAGFFAPLVTGVLLQATGHFASAFLLAGAVNILGLVGWVWMLPKIEPLDWSRLVPAGRAPEVSTT
jgi:nitrate/nitrite transporter NarK